MGLIRKNMMHKAVIKLLDEKISLVCSRLLTMQNGDGGFRGYHIYDLESGIWSTAEVAHILAKDLPQVEKTFLIRACKYLAANQNADGGWAFRTGGKSITDITSWSCVALSHCGYATEIIRGIDFILKARTNEIGGAEDGWGLTSFEPDRIYSTHIASYCIARLLGMEGLNLPGATAQEMRRALGGVKEWLTRLQNPDGGWPPIKGQASTCTSTALALLTLFLQGEDPQKFAPALEFLRSYVKDGLWVKEAEIVITREGYELVQEWFTSVFCMRAFIFFAEMDMVPFEEIDASCQALLSLIEENGTVKADREAAPNLIWAMPFLIEALSKYRQLILSRREKFNEFLERKTLREIAEKKSAIAELLHRRFPYPISYAFFQYEHELDFHRKFQMVIQFYEVIIKYAAIVSLSGYLSQNGKDNSVNKMLQSDFARPSLGYWTSLLEALLKLDAGDNGILYPLKGDDVLKGRTNYIDPDIGKSNLNQDLARIASLRNENTGHGALKSLFEYRQMVEREDALLLSFVDRMSYLSKYNSFLVLASEYDDFGEGDKYRIRSFNGLKIQDSDLETSRRLAEGQRDQMIRYIYFQNTSNNSIVNLYPFLSFTFCKECKKEHFFIFNGKKSQQNTAYLSYECGHILEHENGNHFEKRFEPSGIKY
jgi:Prenyltransferase and squalene oxidase repeat